MNRTDLKETDLWTLYQNSITYSRQMSAYADTDKNWRMYNGNQWYGLKCIGIEPVQLNYIKSIVNFKVGRINTNLWGVNYSSETVDNEQFRPLANKLCKMINKYVNKIWEKEGMDYKIRMYSLIAAVDDESVFYTYWDKESKMPIVELLNKNDIYYGNENNPDIQSQPYIIIKRRMPVINVQDMAMENGIPLDLIVGDNENLEESGEKAKYEKDPMVTVLTKLYKEKGRVHYEIATRCAVIQKDNNLGLKNYPVTHFPWAPKPGSARGEGVVRNLTPNQIELNKTLMRQMLVTKKTAYPQRIVNVSRIVNPEDVEKIGATIRVKGETIGDIKQVFDTTQPVQLSFDLERLKTDLIQTTRDLEGASDIATGSVNPEDASGKAIVAVQDAANMPLTEQVTYLKRSLEELARIFFDMIVAYTEGKLKLEDEVLNEDTDQVEIRVIEVPTYVLEELRLSAKIDITPKSAYDKFAQERTYENLLEGGYFTAQRLPELKVLAKVLDDDATINKQKLNDAIAEIERQQRKIDEIQQRVQKKAIIAKQLIDDAEYNEQNLEDYNEPSLPENETVEENPV